MLIGRYSIPAMLKYAYSNSYDMKTKKSKNLFYLFYLTYNLAKLFG